MVLHSTLCKAHEETDITPHSVIYRPVGSTMTFSLSLHRHSYMSSLYLSLYLLIMNNTSFPKNDKVTQSRRAFTELGVSSVTVVDNETFTTFFLNVRKKKENPSSLHVNTSKTSDKICQWLKTEPFPYPTVHPHTNPTHCQTHPVD